MFSASTAERIKKYFSEAHYIFLLIAIPAVWVFANHVPPAWGLDEQVHIARMYSISEGNFYPDATNQQGRYGAELPLNLIINLNDGHAESNGVDRNKQFYQRKDIVDLRQNEDIQSLKFDNSRTEYYDFGPTGPYAPIVYAPGALAMNIGKILNLSIGPTIELSRIAQSLMYFVSGFVALYILKSRKVKWLLFTVLLLPATVFQAAVITADTFTIAAMTLFFAVIYRMFLLKSIMARRDIVLLLGSMLLLVFTKQSYALVLLLVLFLPNNIFRDKRQLILVKYGGIMVATIMLMITTVVGLEFSDSMMVYKEASEASRINLASQIQWVLSNPIEFIKVFLRTVIDNASPWTTSLVGWLGYNTIATPFVLILTTLAALWTAALYSSDLSSKNAVLFLASGIISASAVIFILYATFNTIGSMSIIGVQGRYFIPVLPFIFNGLSSLLGIKLHMTNKKALILFSVLAFMAVYVTLSAYLMAIY